VTGQLELLPRAWQRLVPHAKRRILTDGPPFTGHDALRIAVIVVAAELASLDVSEQDALTICASIPFTPGRTPESRVRKQIPAFVRWAYSPPDGIPILTGCPRAADRYGSTDSPRGRLKAIFEPYCDDDCFPCPIFLARSTPELTLIGSKYEPLLISHIWMSHRQGGLGAETRQVWMTLAAIAEASGQDVIEASSHYIAHRLGGKVASRTVRHHLSRLGSHGLVETTHRKKGWRRIVAFDQAAVDALEQTLGVLEAARWNRVEANWDSLRKAIEAPEWDVAAELAGTS
jgi:DNA-binding transcriptional ArsR family regulator